jgi:CRP-like cAMP-binding protein
MSQVTKNRLPLARFFGDARAMVVFTVVLSAAGALSLQAGFGAQFLIVVGAVALSGTLWSLNRTRTTESLTTRGACTPGEWIRIGQYEGEVVAIGRQGITLRARSGDAITVPRGRIATAEIVNLSRALPAHTETIRVSLPSNVPPGEMTALLTDAAQYVAGVREDRSASCFIVAVGVDSVAYDVMLPVCNIEEIPSIRSEFAAHVWYRMTRAGFFPAAREPASPSDRLEQALSALDCLPLFDVVPVSLKEEVARTSVSGLWGAGETVVKEGLTGDCCYVVRSGELGVYVTEDGFEKQVSTLHGGEMFGEMSLLTGEPRTATVRVLQDSELLHVHSETLKSVLRRSTDLSDGLAKTVALRTEDIAEARADLAIELEERFQANTSALSSQAPTFEDLGEDAPAGSEGIV